MRLSDVKMKMVYTVCQDRIRLAWKIGTDHTVSLVATSSNHFLSSFYIFYLYITLYVFILYKKMLVNFCDVKHCLIFLHFKAILWNIFFELDRTPYPIITIIWNPWFSYGINLTSVELIKLVKTTEKVNFWEIFVEW